MGNVIRLRLRFRKPTLSDLPELQALVNYFFQADRRRTTPPDIGLTFVNFQRNPEQGQIVVFEADDGIIGYAILIFYWSNEYGGNVIVIDEMVVKDGHQDQGIPANFISWVEDSFSRDAAGMSVQVSQVDDKAAKLYRDYGFYDFPCNNLLRVFGT